MIVYVNNEERELHVYDRSSGVDYAKSVICSQERLDTGILSEQEYDNWKEILQIVQESEDIRYALKDIADPDELKEYIFEDTQYLVNVRETAETERVCLKELQQALERKDKVWLRKNGFIKTIAYLVRKNPCQCTHVVISLKRYKFT
jgi:hypothetical protein